MNVMNANQAKTQFGELLMKAQREPIQINKNGKAVAVVVSMEEYEQIDLQKQQYLQLRISDAKKQIESGQLSDGGSFFDALESGEFD